MFALLSVLLLALPTTSLAQIQYVDFADGPYNVHFIFNLATYTTDYVIFARYDPPDVYFITVRPDSTFSSPVACRAQSQQRVVWGPIGCSDPANPALATQSANCISSQSTRDERLALLRGVWYLSKETNRCFILGGAGDPRLCTGPVRLAIQGQDSFLPLVDVTDRTILQSQMVFVDALTDPLAMMPTVVEVEILMPALVVTTGGSCTDFDGTYVPYNRQRYPSYLTDVWQTFIKTGCTAACRKISFRQSDGLAFVITFDDTDPEVPAYASDPIEVAFAGVWESWIDVLELGTVYSFNNSCTATFGIESAPAAWQLTGPYPPTANNYSWNINPRRFYNTRVCNYAIGRLGHDLEEVFPFTAEGSKRGGDPLYVDPETGFPLGVDPDNVDYRFDCSEFYPLNESFLDFGLELDPGTRTLINRMAVDQEMCFAPFPLPDLIIENKNPDERYVQCQKLGGYVYGSATTMCGRPITQIDCPLNYYYFDQRCFWKFNPATDQRFAVSSGDADASCKLVNPLLAALVQIDIYTQQWLLDWYLNIKRDVNTYALYRIPQFNSPGCQIFNSSSGEIAYDQSCFNTLDGDLYVFPICYYPITISQLEPKYKDQQISLKGALLRARGQVGPRPNGKEAVCSCFTGWTGKNCEVATCPLEDLLLNSTDTATDTLFFKKCYLNKQGGCYERNPRVCQCMTPFAPDASLLDSLPLLKQFEDFPCMCPAAPQKLNPFFTINSTQYRIPFAGQRIPCSGDQNGNCLIAGNSSNAVGVCECVQRYNILEDVLEDAFDGRACSCSRPIQPYGGLSKNGPIITDLCNNHGYCAPFGESVADPVGYIYLVNQSTPGCQCNNGWGGAACTCPTPFDYLDGRPTLTSQERSSIYYYKDIGSKQLISWVRTNCTLPGNVALSNLVGGGAAENVSSLACTFNEPLQLFACPDDEAYQYVILTNGVFGGIYCTAEAYSIMYNYCGENNTVNAFAGRFYQLGSYRDSYKYQLQQPFTTASYGCTESGCMCNADYGGRLCAARVSSYRLEQSFISNILTPVWTKEYCGETTLLPTLLNPVGSRGRITNNECTCNPISAVDPSGRRGAVQNRFSASACQCVVAQDPLDQILKTCAGHGECEEPSFIYGWCEVDLDTYSQDSLSRPFNAVVDPAGQTFQLTAVVDSFFYGYSIDAVPTPAPVPVVSPTRFPTKNPVSKPVTDSPTTNPTTKTPTTSPTAPTTNKPTSNPTTGTPTTPKPTTASPTPAALKLYRAQYTSLGSLGNRGTTTTTCGASSYRPSGCSQTPMMVSYSAGDSITGLQPTYGFSASSVVQGPTGTQVASSWAQLMSGTLTVDLYTAGVLPAAVSWWSGTTTSSNNCGGWTDFSVFGNAYVGRSDKTDIFWANSAGTTACSTYLYQVCLCVP